MVIVGLNLLLGERALGGLTLVHAHRPIELDHLVPALLKEVGEALTRIPENFNAHRTLRRVTIKDAQAAEKMFELLMGNEVGPRKDFISNADIDRDRIDA